MSLARRNRLDQAFIQRDRLAHPGLVLSRYLGVPLGHDGFPEARRDLTEHACRAQRTLQALYAAAFHRRESRLADLATSRAQSSGAARSARGSQVETFHLTTPPGGRLIVGLGRESPLETGLTLDHTYGVPIISGSALKGLAAHYCHEVLGQADPTLRRDYSVRESNDGGETVVKNGPHHVLFGDTDDAGFLTFHDAWISPESLVVKGEGLLADVITPHHGDYYGGKRYQCADDASLLHGQFIPPTDFDDPKPVQFISVRGTFHFALACADATDEGARWLGWAKALLQRALADWGIGGKTSSGYGRLVVPEEKSADQTVPPGPVPPPDPPPQPVYKSGQSVSGELLSEKTKKKGWRAKIVGTSHKGAIVNSDQVPTDKKAGDVLPLTIHSPKLASLSFRYVPAGQSQRADG